MGSAQGRDAGVPRSVWLCRRFDGRQRHDHRRRREPAGARLALLTVHGAGRLFGRKEAKRRFTREQMDWWLQDRGVTLIGADLDESPMAYRRLPEVIAQHAGTVKVLHTLRPFAVVMAGTRELDPWKD